MSLEEIRNNTDLLNEIDWEMTPEQAVSLYLEWGNGWNHGVRMIKSKDDVSYYWVVNNWEDKPVIYLIKRRTDEAEEIAEIELPAEQEESFNDYAGNNKGVWRLNDDLKDWLKQELAA